MHSTDDGRKSLEVRATYGHTLTIKLTYLLLFSLPSNRELMRHVNVSDWLTHIWNGRLFQTFLLLQVYPMHAAMSCNIKKRIEHLIFQEILFLHNYRNPNWGDLAYVLDVRHAKLCFYRVLGILKKSVTTSKIFRSKFRNLVGYNNIKNTRGGLSS